MHNFSFSHCRLQLTMYFLGLPDEVILKIFGNVHLQDLFFNVALVNKQFHKISKDSTLLKVVILKDIDEYVFGDTKKALEHSTMIKDLTVLKNVLNPEELLKSAFQNNMALKTLTLNGQISTELAKAVQTFGKSLEHLKLESHDIEQEALMHLTKLKNLKSINISSNLELEQVKSLALNCKNLESVTFYCSETAESMEYFCEALQHSLTNLTFEYFWKTDWDFTSISKLTKLKKLTIDVINGFAITRTQVLKLAKIPNLEVFHLIADTKNYESYDKTFFEITHLISHMNVERLKELTIRTLCNKNLKSVYETVIQNIGAGLEKLILWSKISWDKDSCCECKKENTLNEQQVSKLLKKCANLKELAITGRHFSLEFLNDIKRSHDLNLILEPRIAKSLEEFNVKHTKCLEQDSFQNDTRIENLAVPKNVLIKVLQYLKLQEILHNIALVSKQFYKLSKEPSLFNKMFFFKIDKNNLQYVEKFLKSTSELRELDVYRNFTNIEHLITLALQNNKDLKNIRCCNQISEEEAQALADHGQHIEHLDLNCCYQGGFSSETYMSLSKLKHLKSIKFRNFQGHLSSEHVREISRNQNQLEDVEIPLIPSLSKGMDEFCTNLEKYLVKLTLNMFPLQSTTPDHFWDFALLHRLANLKELELMNYLNQFNDIQIANLAKLSSLKVFKYHGINHQMIDHLIKLFSSLKLDALEKLEIKIVCSTDLPKFFEVVVSKLGENIEYLTLKCTMDCGYRKCQYEENLTQQHVEAIVVKCPKLKKLEIHGTKLPDQYLCQIENKNNFQLIVDPTKAKTMKRFKMMNTKIL